MESNEGKFKMEVSIDMEKELTDLFNLEIEILQGERKVLPSGMISISVIVADPLKIEMIKEFCLKLISMSHTQNLN